MVPIRPSIIFSFQHVYTNEKTIIIITGFLGVSGARFLHGDILLRIPGTRVPAASRQARDVRRPRYRSVAAAAAVARRGGRRRSAVSPPSQLVVPTALAHGLLVRDTIKSHWKPLGCRLPVKRPISNRIDWRIGIGIGTSRRSSDICGHLRHGANGVR